MWGVHARRKFIEASKVSKKAGSTQEALKHIQKLYRIESNLRSQELDKPDFLSERKRQAEQILDKFRTWLIKREEHVVPSSELGKAIRYSLKQWDKLIVYLETPYLSPDNNASENAIRPKTCLAVLGKP